MTRKQNMKEEGKRLLEWLQIVNLVTYKYNSFNPRSDLNLQIKAQILAQVSPGCNRLLIKLLLSVWDLNPQSQHFKILNYLKLDL
jgi:hypothetical protein